MTDFKVKRAKLNDYKTIKNIQKQGYGSVVWHFYELLVEHLLLGGREYIVFHENKKVGFLHVRRAGIATRDIINICFLPDYQQLGLGTKTMDWVKGLNEKTGIQNLTLHVRSQNTHVVNWYKKQGFVEIRRVKCYYRDTEDDALKMRYTDSKVSK